ncbi:hypothetical protein U9M48_037557 [Paspalum notatum var. saurae]|uniref:Uncharacterized protein n=1 Tax=Paspalum notatum var. saurae TaxID=547442 RepID=A0AAQ3XCJ0_PASNO
MIYYMGKLQLVLYVTPVVLFHSSLYVRRLLRHRRLGLRPQQRRRLRRGLAYMAILLASLISAIFFCSFDRAGMPLSLGIGVWFALAVAARCFYAVTVLPLDGEKDLEDENEVLLLQRAPV